MAKVFISLNMQDSNGTYLLGIPFQNGHLKLYVAKMPQRNKTFKFFLNALLGTETLLSKYLSTDINDAFESAKAYAHNLMEYIEEHKPDIADHHLVTSVNVL